MRLEELTNFDAIGIAYKFKGWTYSASLTCSDWKSSQVVMWLEALTNLRYESIPSGWHDAIGRAHEFSGCKYSVWLTCCDWKSSQILMRLKELTNFDAIGSSHKFYCDWKRSRIYRMKVFRLADRMRLEELTNFDAVGSAHKFTWWKSCAVLGPRPAGWTASIPRSSRRWPAWSWGPCCRSSGPQTDRSHLGQHRWTQFIIN